MKAVMIAMVVAVAAVSPSFAGLGDAAAKAGIKIIKGAGGSAAEAAAAERAAAQRAAAQRAAQSGRSSQSTGGYYGGRRGSWGGGYGDSGSSNSSRQPVQITCPSCNGRGQVSGALWGTNTCSSCGGSGVQVIYP